MESAMESGSAIHWARHWWEFALRGLAAVLFGVLAFAWPGLTLAALVLLWGAYALVDGVLALVSAIRGQQRDQRWSLLLEGVVGIAAGIAAFAMPGLTAIVLLYIIAAWAILTGILEIVAAVRMRRAINNEWLLVLGGVGSIVFGVLLAVAPGAGALALIWLIAAYSILAGVVQLALAFRLYGEAHRRREPVAAAAASR